MDYARVPISFEVRSILDVEAPGRGLGGLIMQERSLAAPYVKDYDAGDGGPAQWASRFDLARWGFFSARSGRRWIGAAAIVFDTAGLHMLAGRRDLAVLWDLRIAAEARRHGVGSALFQTAERWAATRGCLQLKVETQNINVPACRFYARMGCVLGGIDRFAYPDLPDEAQLLWYKALSPASKNASS